MTNWWKYGLAFLAGAAFGAVVCKKSREIRGVCTRALGGVLDLKDKAMEAAETIKESAEDLLAESDARRRDGKADAQ
jgi:hypothetical protein